MTAAEKLRAWNLARRKWNVTEELREEIRRAYAGNRTHLTRSLDVLERRTRWPRWALAAEGKRQGWQRVRRPWKAEEDERLREWLGTRSVGWIARALGRTRESVQCRAYVLGHATRYSEGYSLADLMRCFGERWAVVERWQRKGLLGRNGGRIADEAVVRFIRAHAGEYDLRRVDQAWFKSMVFGR